MQRPWGNRCTGRKASGELGEVTGVSVGMWTEADWGAKGPGKTSSSVLSDHRGHHVDSTGQEGRRENGRKGWQ